MRAFLAARDLGADAIEFDVHMTVDGHLVVTHDYDLARTTSGNGLVHERDLGYVRSLSAGAWFGEEFAAEPVPLLDEVLALDGLDFELEVKGLPTERLVAGIAHAVRNADVLDRVTFTGFHLLALARLRAELPSASFGLFPPSHQPWMSDQLYEQIATETAIGAGFDVVHIPSQLLDKVNVERLHGRGLLVQAAGATTPEQLAAAVARDVDSLTTDDPDLAVRTLRGSRR